MSRPEVLFDAYAQFPACVKIPANRLGSHLSEPLKPCYLVTGDEPLLVEEALDAIREAARRQGFDWNVLASAGSELSLFASRRIVELRLPTGKPGREGGAAIVELAEKADQDLLFIVQAPKLDRSAANSKWAKTLEARGALVQVWPIGARDLPQWIGERMRRAGLQPDRDAIRVIADRVEGNLLAADQEVEKLRLLHGEGAVSGDDAREAVADSSRYDVYQLADAALAGNPARALRILDGLRAEGVSEVVVLWAVTRELRLLAQLAEAVARGENLGNAMQKHRVWNSRQNLLRACLGRHNRDGFFALMQAARQADAVAKGQQYGDAWQLATNLIWLLASDRRAA